MRWEILTHRYLFLFSIAFFSSQLCAESRLFNIQIQDGKVPPSERVMRVKKGDQVIWKIRSDAEGELHIHAYQIDLTVKPGVEKKHVFTAFATGRYRVEWHPENERGKGIHHQESLASFEVFPN
ncbi:hypothetical protein DCO17_02625 [Polynucleobacter tropicus]|uniref:EfeO-type cupredoxin-like domain-containing protein n=2 Tax=Polynucleobacter tropicus TaxID=1743174 RepID=A0A6M9PN88_9BURK|nr:hypothetical protein DCO17_02625 [Polynucleobacter tropicus]